MESDWYFPVCSRKFRSRTFKGGLDMTCVVLNPKILKMGGVGGPLRPPHGPPKILKKGGNGGNWRQGGEMGGNTQNGGKG